eukprot:COSAG01_NODE_10025_length_2272_cov_1.554073_1_plen_203_part_00
MSRPTTCRHSPSPVRAPPAPSFRGGGGSRPALTAARGVEARGSRPLVLVRLGARTALRSGSSEPWHRAYISVFLHRPALAGHRHTHVLIASITQAAAQNNLRCQPILTAASGVGHREQCLGSARNGGAGCRPAAAFQRQTIRRDAFPPERQGGGAWLICPGASVAVFHRCCIIAATIGRPATHHHLAFIPHCTRSAQSSPSW